MTWGIIEVQAVGQWLDPKLRAGAEESFAYQMLEGIRDELTELDPSETIVRLWNRHEMGSTIREVPEDDQPLVDELKEAKAEIVDLKTRLAEESADCRKMKRAVEILRRACFKSKSKAIVGAVQTVWEMFK